MDTISKMDLRTPLQRRRAERNKLIYTQFLEMMQDSDNTGVTKWAVIRTVAELHGLTAQGVRGIIVKLEKDSLEP